jgi:hypothetical protein
LPQDYANVILATLHKITGVKIAQMRSGLRLASTFIMFRTASGNDGRRFQHLIVLRALDGGAEV